MGATAKSLGEQRLREEMAAATRDATRTDPRLTGSQWAETYYHLERIGRWRWESAPYMRGIQDSFCDPNVPEIVLMKGAQISGTMGGLVPALGYSVHQRPTRVLVYFPTEGDAKKFSEDKLDSAFRETPVLRNAFVGRHNDKVLEKRYPGGVIYIHSGGTATTFRQTDAEHVFLDDLDAFVLEVGREGDPWGLAEGRTRSYRRAKRGAISSPTVKGRSRIESLYEGSDRRRYHVACPFCRERQVLRWGGRDTDYGFKWDTTFNEDREKVPVLRSIAYMCEACGKLIEERHKAGMVRKAAEYSDRGWIAEKPERSADRHGYHLPQFVSLFPGASWRKILKHWYAAKDSKKQLRTFVQQVKAETWVEDPGEAPEWRRIYDRREHYPIGTCPEGVEFVTVGVDVQREPARLEAFVWGWGYDRESWFIEHLVFEGNATQKSTWTPLKELLGKTWPGANGTDFPVARMAIDTGYLGSAVAAFARSVGDPRIMLVKGDHWKNWKVVIGTPTGSDTKAKTGKRFGLKLWPVGGALVKEETYGFLGLETPRPGEPYPAGWIHLPLIPAELCEQFVAEELVTEENDEGYTERYWRKTRKRNEFLDGRVYARAAAEQMGLSRMRRKVEVTRPPRPPRGDDDWRDDGRGGRRRGGGGFLGGRRGGGGRGRGGGGSWLGKR